MQYPEARLTPGFVFPACRMSAMFTFYMNKRAQGLFDPGCEPTLAGTEEKVLDMRKTAVFLLCLMVVPGFAHAAVDCRSEEHTSELQSLMRHSYAVFGLQKKKQD